MSTPKTQFRSMPAEDDHEFDADMPIESKAEPGDVLQEQQQGIRNALSL